MLRLPANQRGNFMPTLRSFLVLALFLVGSAEAQSSGPLDGVWIRVATVGPTGTLTPSPPAMRTFIAGHWSWLQATGDRPVPDANATAEQLRETLVATASGGTYEVAGRIITQRHVVDLNPRNMASEFYTRFAYELRGDSLWLTQIENSVRGLGTALGTGLYVRARQPTSAN
jgi:hypothetical protein